MRIVVRFTYEHQQKQVKRGQTCREVRELHQRDVVIVGNCKNTVIKAFKHTQTLYCRPTTSIFSLIKVFM